MTDVYKKQDPTFPRTIGPYQIQRIIGRGAQGVVYLASVQGEAGNQVALKVIENQGNLDRSMVEVDLLSRIDHPNIVRLRDYFLFEESLVLVLDYIDGPNLQSYLEQRGRLAPEEVTAFLIQMGRALEHAHGRQVIHRDIKLSNILIHQKGGRAHYVLSDFGVARIATGIQPNRRIGGTYQFMAPEQLRGRPGVQSDLWGLGVVAYALLRGHLPFEGTTIQEMYDKVMLDTPSPPSDGANPELDRIISHLLEKGLEGRTDSAVALLDELGLAAVKVAPIVKEMQKSSTHEKFTEMKARESRIIICLSMFLLLLSTGLAAQALALIGSYLIYYAYTRSRGNLYLIIAIFCLISSCLIEGIVNPQIPAWIGMQEYKLVWHYIDILLQAFWIYYICKHIVKTRRYKRELLLLRAIRGANSSLADIVPSLRKYVQIHPGDLSVYQRYVEALLATGQVYEAAVEARLMLRVDPYNVGATLLLANAYSALGLHESCIALCSAYLAVTGYCFEFADLRDRSLRAIEGAQ